MQDVVGREQGSGGDDEDELSGGGPSDKEVIRSHKETTEGSAGKYNVVVVLALICISFIHSFNGQEHSTSFRVPTQRCSSPELAKEKFQVLKVHKASLFDRCKGKFSPYPNVLETYQVVL